MTEQIDKAELYNFILSLFLKEKVILLSYLNKQIRTRFNLSRYQSYRIIKKLVKMSILRETKIDNRTIELSLADYGKLVDLIMCEPARNKSTTDTTQEHEPTRRELLTHARQLLKPRFSKMNIHHREAVNTYALFSRFEEKEKLEVNALFELYLSDVKEKMIWLRNAEGEDLFLEYKTRYTSKAYSIEIIKKAENAFKIATSMFNFGVFLTITIPPIFPQRLALWILSFLLHRIKAYCLRKFKQKIVHFKAIEPQNQWTPHYHVILFGVDFLMYKTELTAYLEKHLNNFLNNLGRHYKKTINKRATDFDILALNELGQVYIKKYNKYKKQKHNYSGPINWITRIYSKEGTYEFENPPPDLKSKHEPIKQENKTMQVTVFDYLKFYMIKNVQNANEIAEMEIPQNEKVYIAWYWLNRLPFFTCSPILRTTHPPKPPSNFVFIRSITKEEYDYLTVEIIVKSPY